MTLKLEAIKNAGVIEYERILLRASADIDAGEYLVICADASEGFPQSGDSECYWLPDNQVKTNDLIVIYTKYGRRSTKQNKSGSTTYFYYWAKDRPIWAPDKIAVLMRSSEFTTLVTDYPGADDIEPTPGESLRSISDQL